MTKSGNIFEGTWKNGVKIGLFEELENGIRYICKYKDDGKLIYK